MFDFTETVDIDATPAAVWELMRDLERWWPASNPEHVSLERLDTGARELGVGSRLRIRERIAGIPGEATGEITVFVPGWEVTWEAPAARYRLAGVGFTVGEGVTWGIRPSGSATRVSAHVWATFPPGFSGRLLQWSFEHLFHGIERDREHARTELRYLKRVIEAGVPT